MVTYAYLPSDDYDKWIEIHCPNENHCSVLAIKRYLEEVGTPYIQEDKEDKLDLDRYFSYVVLQPEWNVKIRTDYMRDTSNDWKP